MAANQWHALYLWVLRFCWIYMKKNRTKKKHNFRNSNGQVARIFQLIYTFGKMRSAFITPSRARCTLVVSTAAFTPFDATLLYELTCNVLQRKLFNCIKITTNNIVGILVVVCAPISYCSFFLYFSQTFCIFLCQTEWEINDNFLFFVFTIASWTVLLWQILQTFVCRWCWRMISCR